MGHYLVTGGAGFIGSHLVDRLLRDGHQVRVLDNFATGRRANIEAVRASGPDRLQVSSGDIREPKVVEPAVKGVDGVFHLAALGSVPRSVANPGETHAVNATGTLNLLVAARDAGIKRFVFAGSSSVYGSLETLPKHEDHPVCPISPYGLTKLMGEHYLRLFRELYDMETVTTRFYNVFGPRQDPASQYAAVVPSFLSKLSRGEAPVIHGDGEQSRDFTYVGNVADVCELAMTSPAENVAAGLFNVAEGGRHSVNELLELLQKHLGTNIQPIHGEARPGDVKHSQADVTRLREHLGYRARVTFAEGVEKTVQAFQDALQGS